MTHDIIKTDNYLLVVDDGYNKAREKYDSLIIKTLNKFDIEIKKHLLMYSIEHSIHGKMCDGINEIRCNIIQSLSQQKIPIGFECAYQSSEDRYYEDGVGYTHNVKRTTNNLGQTQWVGKYIYS